MTAKGATQVAISFSLRRAPLDTATSSRGLFREALRMIEWADGRVTAVSFSEHHVSSDGFMTSPLLFSAAAASVTSSVNIAIMALLLPLHDPVRVAEQLCNLDLMSEGRTRTVLGLGYRPSEYQVFGVDWAARGRIFDEKTAVVVALLRGETIEHEGVEVALDHLPESPVDSIVFMGGNSLHAARRAARHRLGLIPAVADPRIESTYHEHAREVGFDGYYEVPDAGGYTLISHDPDKTWANVGSFLLFDAMAYQSIAHATRTTMLESDADSIRALRESGAYQVLTPQQALDQIGTGGFLILAPLTGGLPADLGWETLRLYESEVLPEITLSSGLFERDRA